MKKDFLSFAGDVQIQELMLYSVPSGNSQNITNQVIGIQIFEDMFSPYISGNIVVRESLDILNNLPITGQEWLSFRIKTPTLQDEYDIGGLFYVYKISDREFLAEKNVVYKLHFISIEALNENTTKLSKGYGGKVSDLAKTVLTDWVGESRIGFIEETKNSTKYVSNFWTPVKNMNFLANQAINMNDSPSYLFFENRGGFNFISLDTLYKTDVMQTFNYNMTGRDVLPTGQSVRLLENDYQRINNIVFPESFDTVSHMSKGSYASTLYTHDLVSKRFKVNKFEYIEKFDKQNHLNKYPLTAKAMAAGFFKPSAAIFTNEQEYGVFSGFGDVSNSSILQQRVSTINQAEGLRVTIVVPGRTDYTVGQKVNLKIVQPEPISEKDTYENEEDKIFSGNYLISAINHSISRERHECTMELIKDSWVKNVDNFNES